MERSDYNSNPNGLKRSNIGSGDKKIKEKQLQIKKEEMSKSKNFILKKIVINHISFSDIGKELDVQTSVKIEPGSYNNCRKKVIRRFYRFLLKKLELCPKISQSISLQLESNIWRKFGEEKDAYKNKITILFKFIKKNYKNQDVPKKLVKILENDDNSWEEMNKDEFKRFLCSKI